MWRNREAIDSELRLLAAVRRVCRVVSTAARCPLSGRWTRCWTNAAS